MYNKSQSGYLICYHGPKLIIEEYRFNVELVKQEKTSMHGSAEGHTGYIYRRNNDIKAIKAAGCKTQIHGVPCDPLFAKAWEICRGGLNTLSEFTTNEVDKHWGVTKKRVTRSDMKNRSADVKAKETKAANASPGRKRKANEVKAKETKAAKASPGRKRKAK